MVATRILLGLVIACLTWAGQAVVQSEPAPPRDLIEIAVPAPEGRIQVADLLRAVLREGGLPEEHAAYGLLDRIDWPLDLNDPAVERELRAINGVAGGAMRIDVEPQRVSLTVDRDAARVLRAGIERSLERWGQQLTSALRGRRRPVGISLVAGGGAEIPLGAAAAMPPRLVLLVHGLDEPGWIWDDMIAALLGRGHAVGVFEYPNDGPISEATDLLARELEELRRRGTQRVDIVAHSMGGLVSRDVLTRPAYYGGDGAGAEGRLPAVDRLIMIGTPNQGSEMVRLRGMAELREQVVRVFREEGAWADALADGAGEAGVDLLPGSDFLRRLNERPLPAHTRLTVVAGRMVPVDRERLGGLMQRLSAAARRAGIEIPADPDRALAAVEGVVDSVGDGLVTIESARLEGVEDQVVVQGNHHSIVHGLLGGGEPPPAVGIVLDRLDRP
jgi:pimeloyl-ACP methyl ester carboxylesterase